MTRETLQQTNPWCAVLQCVKQVSRARSNPKSPSSLVERVTNQSHLCQLTQKCAQWAKIFYFYACLIRHRTRKQEAPSPICVLLETDLRMRISTCNGVRAISTKWGWERAKTILSWTLRLIVYTCSNVSTLFNTVSG